MKNRTAQSDNNISQTIFLIYELGHVDELLRFFREQPTEEATAVVMAFSLDIEEKLLEQDISFSSIRTYKKISSDQLSSEDEMMEVFFSDSRWSEFKYRDISVPTIFQFMFRSYLQRVRYYGNMIVPMLEAHSNIKRIVLFSPGEAISKTFGILARREINVIIDCARAVTLSRGIPVTVMPPLSIVSSFRSYFRPLIFSIKRAIFSLFLRVWNILIAIFSSSHPRMLISDHWKNVRSSIETMDRGECIFLDRTEILHIDWRNLLKYRMRFVHVENFLSRTMRLRARDSALMLNDMWKKMRDSLTPIFSWQGYSFDSLLVSAIDDIASDFERIVCEIEGTYALYEKLNPNIVLLRASVSAQTHFSILPLVAKNSGIPSLELQHGLEYLGPGSWSRNHAAEYIAVYGPLVKRELVAIGYPGERVREIGSPRFDTYRTKFAIEVGGEKLPQKLIILCIAPDIRPFEIYDSYSAEDYFVSVAKASASVKDVHVIIKLRPGLAGEAMLRKIIDQVFSGISHTIAQYESLNDLYLKSTVVVSCFSTAILEALQAGVPVIIPAFNSIDKTVVNFHFSLYKEARVLSIVSNDKEFSDALSELAFHTDKLPDLKARIIFFISDNFCFDGNSSERYAHLVKELSSKSKDL